VDEGRDGLTAPSLAYSTHGLVQYSDSPVTSVNRLASVDLPAPALPNTATFLIASTCQPSSFSQGANQ
jgi:hypothetical protein